MIPEEKKSQDPRKKVQKKASVFRNPIIVKSPLKFFFNLKIKKGLYNALKKKEMIM